LRFVAGACLKITLLWFAMFGLAMPAYAGLFSVSPVRIFMTPQDKATAVTINNDGNEFLVMQADVYDWKQKPDGEDDLTLTQDMLVYPPIIKVPPKSHQVVRLARLVHMPQSKQSTYRLIVREIPEVHHTQKKLAMTVALAFSMPVFITPADAKNKLDCSVERISSKSVNAVCHNSGNAYAQVLGLALTNAKGHNLANSNQVGYILPDITRKFELKSATTSIPAGPASLSLKLDDGSKQTFNVVLAK
jgi:fimbrial chaperone protein